MAGGGLGRWMVGGSLHSEIHREVSSVENR